MEKLSSRERLLRVFRREPTDRMPIRIWGIDPMLPTGWRTWKPLSELVERYELDVLREWWPTRDGQVAPPVKTRTERRESDKSGVWEDTTVMETPAGELTQVFYAPKSGIEGQVKKHYIESVDDAKKWLSIPVDEPEVNVEGYRDIEHRTAGDAMLMIFIEEAMYKVQAMMGSVTFAFWLKDERPLLAEMIERAYGRIEWIAKQCLAAGIGDCYGWVGPELCIPPLASLEDFREFVFDYDKRIADLVHDAGKLVWVHCHGDMDPVLEDFIEMGVDCLNPMEPPPVGRLTLAEAKRRIAGRMSLDGGVQDGAFYLLEPDQMVQVVEETVAMGKPGGGFILCPSSPAETAPSFNQKELANYRAFVETAVRLASYD